MLIKVRTNIPIDTSFKIGDGFIEYFRDKIEEDYKYIHKLCLISDNSASITFGQIYKQLIMLRSFNKTDIENVIRIILGENDYINLAENIKLVISKETYKMVERIIDDYINEILIPKIIFTTRCEVLEKSVIE